MNQLEKPRFPGEAFRAGVKGAPFCAIDSVQIELNDKETRGPNVELFAQTPHWAPTRELDVLEAYRTGRTLRRIGYILDTLKVSTSVGEAVRTRLAEHGLQQYLLHKRGEAPTYSSDALTQAFITICGAELGTVANQLAAAQDIKRYARENG